MASYQYRQGDAILDEHGFVIREKCPTCSTMLDPKADDVFLCEHCDRSVCVECYESGLVRIEKGLMTCGKCSAR